jgi:hypothetical protein
MIRPKENSYHSAYEVSRKKGVAGIAKVLLKDIKYSLNIIGPGLYIRSYVRLSAVFMNKAG